MSPATATPSSRRSTSSMRAGQIEAPERAEALAQAPRARGAVSDGLAVVRDAEVDVRVRQRDALEEPQRAPPAPSAAALRNLSRAGVLKKRSCTSTVVPAGRGHEQLLADHARPRRARASPCRRAARAATSTAKRVTAQMAGSASPRKPSVAMASRSSSVASLEVAWRASARSTSSAVIPMPSSVTRMSWRPASRRSTVTARASASSAFSTSSFTTEAGRSTTSPAAILLTR